MISKINSVTIKLRKLIAGFGMSAIVLVAFLALPVVIFQQPVNAAACGAASDGFFFGLPPWHRGLKCDNGAVDLSDMEIGNIIVIVGLNIIDMVVRLMGIVAIAFIVIGGFQYMLARGEASNVAKGKATVTHAVIGLIIVMASSTIVGFLVSRIGV